MARDLDQIKADAASELREWVKDNPGQEPHDVIHEIADSSVPVYHSDLLRIAAEDNDVALAEPELGPAFDGKPTPVNIIAANIYEAIEASLWEEWRTIQEELEEESEQEAEEEGKAQNV